MENDNLMALAKLEAMLRACAEDAKRPVPQPHIGSNIAINPSPAIVSLANGLVAIADALSAVAQQGEQS